MIASSGPRVRVRACVRGSSDHPMAPRTPAGGPTPELDLAGKGTVDGPRDAVG